MKWQPIKTAPEWQRVLVFQREEGPTLSCKTGVFAAVKTGPDEWSLTSHGKKSVRDMNVLNPSPTHWMPLPEAPE